jgi:hypothetical protein
MIRRLSRARVLNKLDSSARPSSNIAGFSSAGTLSSKHKYFNKINQQPSCLTMSLSSTNNTPSATDNTPSAADNIPPAPSYKHARTVIKAWFVKKFVDVNFNYSEHLLETQTENRIQQGIKSLSASLGRYPSDAEILKHHGIKG